jgi:hypothetical protein
LVDDLAGAAVEAAVEVAIEVVASAAPDNMPKRYRKGCWWLTFIILALAVTAVIVIALNPSLLE